VCKQQGECCELISKAIHLNPIATTERGHRLHFTPSERTTGSCGSNQSEYQILGGFSHRFDCGRLTLGRDSRKSLVMSQPPSLLHAAEWTASCHARGAVGPQYPHLISNQCMYKLLRVFEPLLKQTTLLRLQTPD